MARARRRGAHVILSGETAWTSSGEGKDALLRRLAQEDLQLEVFAYVRRWIPWINSLFQQAVRAGRRQLVLGQSIEGEILRVRERIEGLFSGYGRSRVSVCLYEQRGFPRGCVVRDFCGRIGYSVPEGRCWRANESLSLEGVKLMFAFNRYCGPVGEWSRPKPPGMGRLHDRLGGLEGPPVELHSTFIKPWLEARKDEDAWLERELGFSLFEQTAPEDSEHAIVRESDLFRYPEPTRDWLAREVGQPKIAISEGEEAAAAVARQVDLLRLRRPSPAEQWEEWVERVRRWWIHRTVGC